MPHHQYIIRGLYPLKVLYSTAKANVLISSFVHAIVNVNIITAVARTLHNISFVNVLLFPIQRFVYVNYTYVYL